MADAKPQSQEKSDDNTSAPAVPKDYYSILSKVIEDVSKDHALLRKLVYALAWHNLKPEAVLTQPIAQAQKEAKSIVELERALELERAIERVEARSWEKTSDPTARPQDPPADPPQQQSFSPPTVEASPAQSDHEFLDVSSAKQDENISAKELPQFLEPNPSSTAITTLSDPPPRAWPERRDVSLQRIPDWLDPSVRVSLDAVEYVPIRQPELGRAGYVSFFQLVAASIFGVLLYVGISGWVYMGRQSVTGPAQSVAPIAQQTPVAPKPLEIQSDARPPQAPPPPEPQPVLPFPLPRTYGVYAATQSRLVALEQLPIKVPISRVMVSAEITEPSKATVAGNDLAFIVYRRDLIGSAPQSVSVRVVARVRRAMKFVDGKASFAPVEGVWRIRDKAYEFQVSPLEANREIVIIQPNPDFIFPPGRYALVLNGYGYDFTVAGNITSPEQCLEQTQVKDGIIVTECPKT